MYNYPYKSKNKSMNLAQLLKSKTIWLGLATICTGMGMFFSGEKTLEELIVITLGVAFSTLRFYTNKPLGSL